MMFWYLLKQKQIILVKDYSQISLMIMDLLPFTNIENSLVASDQEELSFVLENNIQKGVV